MYILGDLLLGIEFFNNLYIVGIGSLQVYLIFEGFFHHKTEMGALGTITIEIFTLVFMLFKRVGKHGFCLFDLHPDLGEVGQFHRGAVLGDQGF